MSKNQKGFGGLIMLLVVLAIILAVGYLYIGKANQDVGMIEEQDEAVEFGETNDELIEELDSMMNEIENSAETDDLTELE